MAEQQLIWESKLDNNWQCEVRRTGEYTGTLTVAPLSGGEPILIKDVTLSYAARFGPDVDNVAEWQEACVAAVDGAAT